MLGGLDYLPLARRLAGPSGASLVSWLRAATSAIAVTLKRWLDWQVINVFEFMTIAEIADVQSRAETLNVTAAVAAAKAAALAAGRELHFPAGTYMATLSVRDNEVCITGEGSSLVTIKHPNVAITNVFELGDTASGNSATAYQKFVIRGFTLDGNRSVVAAPTSDVVGHGMPLTKISGYDISDVRAVNCHNAGFGAFINSNHGKADVYVENCGNATYTGPGFDVNSSKYNHFNFTSKDCYIGGRVLDNCWGNVVRGSVENPTSSGFVYTNQEVNESYGNDIAVTVVGAGGNGASMGMNCHGSNVRFTVKDAADIGFNMAEAAVTTKTFDGSSSGVVDTTNDEITVAAHGWITGRKVMYSPGAGGTAITGLTSGETYWVIRVDNDTLKLATSAANASVGTAINLTAVGAGTSHTLTENLRCVGNNVTIATERSQNQGVFLGGDSNIVHITSNQDGRGGAVGANFAIDVEGNRNTLHVQCLDSNPWKVRGIAVRTGATENEIASFVYDNTADPLNDAGTRTRYNPGTGMGEDIASGAAINIPVKGTVFTVTGTTGINSFTGSGPARVITLVFADVLTLTDGSNLKLAGNFTTSADDILMGMWDGINFYEISRSAN